MGHHLIIRKQQLNFTISLKLNCSPPVTRCGAIEQQRRNGSKHRPLQPANVTNICKICVCGRVTRWHPTHVVVMDYKNGGCDHICDCVKARAAEQEQRRTKEI